MKKMKKMKKKMKFPKRKLKLNSGVNLKSARITIIGENNEHD